MFFSEEAFVQFLMHHVSTTSSDVVIPIGDDAAAVKIPPGELLVATTDSVVEDVHFRTNWITPDFLGMKSMRVNMSDIAAMGATPRYCLVSLIAPKKYCTASFVQGLTKGILTECRDHAIALVGGNFSRGEKLSISITLLASAPKEHILKRSGANIDDVLFLTGSIGVAAAELYCLNQKTLQQAAYLPESRMQFSRNISRSRVATSCIDISDGLAIDLHRLMKASNVGAFLNQSLLPVSKDTRAIARKYAQDVWEWVLYGGEDYELLFTAKRQDIATVLPVHRKQTRR